MLQHGHALRRRSIDVDCASALYKAICESKHVVQLARACHVGLHTAILNYVSDGSISASCKCFSATLHVMCMV